MCTWRDDRQYDNHPLPLQVLLHAHIDRLTNLRSVMGILQVDWAYII